ncbi:WD40 repeat-like protein [Gigaspora margarita]|uniref:WD40 repeat-like protein n=1 Tax=Gigaspora margarita TaxID=4874 RepID=A0A8H4ADI1_GIGMA|nr:WD40 repeat-like protein [Gigaspora margarita]
MLSTETPKDYEVPQPPSDGISCLAFSPVADYLAVSSWDNNVRIYEVNVAAGNATGKAIYSHEKPALCCAWSKDGSKVVSGGADNAGRCFDTTTQQSTQIAIHDQPIRCIKYVDQANLVATGSWDKTIKYWDMRSPSPVLTVALPERCYAMDVIYPLMVVGTADRHVQIYNLGHPSTPYKTNQSPLKFQTRCISCFPSGNGYAIGSIEGRVGIQYIEEKDNNTSFSFKCHRDGNNVYSVNAISFHPIYGTFSTAGSDGTYNFWDKDSKQRLKGFNSVGAPISATTFNRNGTIFTYAASYDWSKGYLQYPSTNKNAIFLHAVKDDDVKPKPAKKSTR